MSAADPAAARRQALAGFKRRLAEVLVRSGLNLHDDLRGLNVLWNKFQVEKVVPASELRPLLEDGAGPPAPPGAHSVLYVNVPFCREKCAFCKFQIRLTSQPAALERYVSDTVAEAEYFAPAFASTRFDFVQAGGGTPSVLSADQMRRLYGAAFRLFRTRKGARRSIEFHPSSTTPEKLRVCRELGFDRVSFGVQSLDPAILARVRREQTARQVRDALLWAREAGFPAVAAELIAGLAGDTAEGFLAGADELMRLEPTSISVNVLNLTSGYTTAEGVSPKSHSERLARLLPEICEPLIRQAARRGFRAEGVGATRGIWKLVREDSDETLGPAQGCEAIARVLGLGKSAWSQFPGRVWFERTTADFAPDAPVYRTRRQTPETATAMFVRHALINGSFIDFAAFQRAFGEDFRRRCALELRLLELYGKVRVEAAGARFLPVNLTERFFYGSIFFLKQWTRLSGGRAKLGPEYLRELEQALR